MTKNYIVKELINQMKERIDGYIIYGKRSGLSQAARRSCIHL